MIKQLKNTLSTGLLFLSMLFFYWYTSSHSSLTYRLDNATLSTTPDHQITNLQVQQFDANGQLTQQLITPFMHHTPYRNKHWLKQPLIVIHESTQKHWDIQAEQATAFHAANEIIFQDHVIIHQPPAGTLTTEKMTYFPIKKMASTEAPITWHQPGNTVKSTGMIAYLESRQIELLHHARMSYNPVHHE